MGVDYILFKTVNENNYLYSYNNNQIVFLHPIMHFLLNLNKRNIEINKWVKKNVKRIYEIKNVGKFTKSDFEYYLKKIDFYLDNGYLKDYNIQNTQRYNADNIKFQLANTNQVSFEVTDSCNLKCEYCVYGEYYVNRDKPMNINLNSEIAKKTLVYLVNLWNSSLNRSHKKMIAIGFYGGEALLNMDFIIDIVNYSKKITLKHSYFSYHMTTNGVLLDKYIDFLVENDFNISISLDGGLESNNKYRKFPNQQSAFKVIYKNILLIQNKYPEYFKRRIGFISVLHNQNSEKEIYNFFNYKFDKTPLVLNLDTDSINPDLIDEFKKMQQTDMDSISDIRFNKFKKTHVVGNVVDFTNFVFTYSGYVKNNYLGLLSNKRESKLPTGTCETFSRKIFITARGKILPCERIGHQFKVGSVNEKDIQLNFEKIANQYNGYFDKIDQLCNKCFLKNSCGVCMFKQKIESKDVYCNSFKDYGKMVNLFSINLSYAEQNNEMYYRILNKVNYE